MKSAAHPAQTLTISPNRLKERPYPTCGQYCMSRARMAELVDAPASGAGAGNGVEVRVLFRAPLPVKAGHFRLWLQLIIRKRRLNR